MAKQPSNNRAAVRLDAACAEALAAARWDEADLSTRRPGADVSALLLAEAAECALSPLARDQLLSLAIERVVDRGDQDGPLLGREVDADACAAIARQVFALGPNRASATDALVESIEGRLLHRLGDETGPWRLAASLREDAELHEMLWDHPAIPAGPGIRLAMLCAIPRLRDRADELMAAAPGWLRGLDRMAGWARRGRSG